MNVFELEKELYKKLEIAKFTNDISLNGLQVGNREQEVKKIVFAVDASLASIQGAIEEGADMLFVHHGLFWGAPLAITGNHYERVKLLLDNNIALFACHLPLDANIPLGNNFQMALRMGITHFDPFGEYKGMSIGFKGELPLEMSTEELSGLLNFAPSTGLKLFNYGKETNKTVAIVSGSASELEDAIKEGVDCFITGEVKHSDFSTIVENKINVIAGGHYQSEVFGVQAVGRMLEKEYGLESVFLDYPSGL